MNVDVNNASRLPRTDGPSFRRIVVNCASYVTGVNELADGSGGVDTMRGRDEMPITYDGGAATDYLRLPRNETTCSIAPADDS